jgi:GAF domain-containing protein
MTNPETAAAQLRAIALELSAAQQRLHQIAHALKDPVIINQSYIEATTAAYHVFSALKAADALAGRLDPSPAPPAQPAPPEAA